MKIHKMCGSMQICWSLLISLAFGVLKAKQNLLHPPQTRAQFVELTCQTTNLNQENFQASFIASNLSSSKASNFSGGRNLHLFPRFVLHPACYGSAVEVKPFSGPQMSHTYGQDPKRAVNLGELPGCRWWGGLMKARSKDLSLPGKAKP